MDEEGKDMVVYKAGDDRSYCSALLTPTIEKVCRFDEVGLNNKDVIEAEVGSNNYEELIASTQETNVDSLLKVNKPSKFVSFFKRAKAENEKDDIEKNKNGKNEQTEINKDESGNDSRGCKRSSSRMGRMTETLSKFKTDKGKGFRSSIRRYQRSLKVITRQVVMADKTWVGCMIGMSTLDIFLNLANFVRMSDDDLNYGLVIGPPSRVLWYTLLIFTCISWLLYVPETLNSLSVLYSPARETYFSIAVEMTITLIFKHIPLSTVVYFVGRCRREYTTSLESVCNGFRLVHILARLVWYAHLEGRKLKRNDKHVLQKSFVLLSLLLFGVATSFVIKNWRNEPDTRLKRYHLVNVSILMLSENHVETLLGEKFPPEIKYFSFEISDLLRHHGYNVERAALVQSILVIKQRRSLTSDYICNSSNGYQKIKPLECDKETKLLRFHFVFHAKTITSPYGEIRYNFAKLSDLSNSNKKHNNPHKQPHNDTDIGVADSNKYNCTDTDEEPKKKWKLYYLESTKFYSNLTREPGIK